MKVNCPRTLCAGSFRKGQIKMGLMTELNERFPLRNTEEQKQAFRDGVTAMLAEHGIEARTETFGKSRNLVIGDPAHAEVLFTAHYDTPKRALFPNVMLPSLPLYLLYNILIVLPFAAFAFGCGALGGYFILKTGNRVLPMLGALALYYLVFFLCFFCFKNPHNLNDNTSGTAAVLTLAMRHAGNPKAAFLLFDNEEHGMLGSKAFAKACPAIRDHALVVNMDCVGNGTHFVLALRKDAASHPAFPQLRAASESCAMPVQIPKRRAVMPSDQMSFRHGVGVAAFRYRKFPGFYTPYIHTPADTVADEANITALTDTLSDFLGRL